ncbi:allophanate hydrolase [Martelella alba]|uniref:Allophanate hydrolase n=1 Tax=Martelella alba TaxID=2590451 RepID=A0ABY2SMR8_9HYPH|nr:allophanate hydrolase [Martelella alba]TKI07185.1 allophanate hydrolase [Martelella alba]
MITGPLYLSALRQAYLAGTLRPPELIDQIDDRIEAAGRDDVWISRRPREETRRMAQELARHSPDSLPFYGIPFSVKDNIDVRGLPTTAACPGYAYHPERSAPVVERLEAAGAICIGKTNMDQFATGLTGVRSPYGACGSAFDAEMIAGGSSSGSAVSVGLHQVCFSLGTDTGGSGRIPAALNNVVGLKPTVGTLSTRGIVPCCRTLDCPSVFALSVGDALAVARQIFQPDPSDPSLRDDASRADFAQHTHNGAWRLLAPRDDQLEFIANPDGAELFRQSLEALAGMGCGITRIDFQPFIEAGNLVFEGPWIADRYAGIGDFVKQHPQQVLPEIVAVVDKSRQWSGADVFRGLERLSQLKARTRALFGADAVLALPTVGPLYSIADIRADPIARNTHQGRYSYFCNILDLCALAVPAGFYPSGLPFGMTLFAPAFHDGRIAGLAGAWLDKRAISPGVPQ